MKVAVAPDHLHRLVRPTQPTYAVIELIWNALDADADDVRVVFERNEAGGIDGVVVTDNGTGIPASRCEREFSSLGGSWKSKHKVTPAMQRPLHGRHGQGRFRAYALGERIEWRTIAADVDGQYRTAITARSAQPEVFHISDPEPTDLPSGTTVAIQTDGKVLSSLDSDESLRRISKEFALYLLRYRNVVINYDGKQIDPEIIIDYQETLLLEVPGYATNPQLQVIEWKADLSREIALCDASGYFITAFQPRIQAPGFSFTAYLQWAEFNSSEALLADMGHPVFGPVLNQAREALRDYFKRRLHERISEVVQGWKTDNVYPFKGEPQDEVDRTKRDLFDVVAVQAIPALTGDRRAKKLSLRLIREALEQSPTALSRVLQDVMELSAEQLADLASLLERTKLGAIISSARVVADRLDMLNSLEFLLFDDRVRKEVLERTQLHRILAKEPWIFGDHFAISVDDKGIQEVLRKHLKYLGRSTLNLAQIAVEGQTTAIVDLMLTKTVEDQDKRHHLVVELKRPTVIVGHDEKRQIEAYGLAVANDPQFRDSGTKWDFVLVANQLSPDIQRLTRKRGLPPGCIHDDDDLDMRIWIKHWGAVIAERRNSLHFVKQRLEIESGTDEGIELLNRKHAEFLPSSALRPPSSSLGTGGTP